MHVSVYIYMYMCVCACVHMCTNISVRSWEIDQSWFAKQSGYVEWNDCNQSWLAKKNMSKCDYDQWNSQNEWWSTAMSEPVMVGQKRHVKMWLWPMRLSKWMMVDPKKRGNCVTLYDFDCGPWNYQNMGVG